MRLSRFGLRISGLLAAVGVAVSGCAASGTPASEVAAAWEKAEEQSAYNLRSMARAAERARMRRWDPCALQAPKAAEQITGDQASVLSPSALDECTLRMEVGEAKWSWTFYVTVGADFVQGDKQDAAPQEINGVTLYRAQLSKSDCGYMMRVSKHFAIKLSASISNDQYVTKKPCQVARSYVTKLLPRWTDPPLRKDKVTSPYIELATFNPCEVPLQEAQQELPPNLVDMHVAAYDLYLCALQDVSRGGETTDRFTVHFGFAPSTKAGSDGTETRVSGQFARAIEDDDGTCAVRTDFNPKVVVDANANLPGSIVDTPVVRVEAGTCQSAKLYLQRVLRAART